MKTTKGTLLVRAIAAALVITGSVGVGAAEPPAAARFVRRRAAVGGPRQMERLGRGVVAINQGSGKVFVSWRLLGTDPESIAFNLYRTAGSGER